MKLLFQTFLLSTVPLSISSFTAMPSTRMARRQPAFSTSPDRHRLVAFETKEGGGGGGGVQEIDVAHLNLTMADLQKQLPQGTVSLESSGYQSTSRMETVVDEGCYWVEQSNALDVTLLIPGLRGQPAACLSVVFSTTTISITAFGRVVWSCIQRGVSDPDHCTFITEDGTNMVPMVQIHVPKRDKGERWGGFILQIGEDSIL
eukprot:scaffold12492_cov51-Attheya_sp.AAC.2